MSQDETRARARELIYIIKTRFVRPDGLLSRSYPPSQRTIFDNFDDIAPFLIYFGETEFLVEQVGILVKNNESTLSLVARDGVLRARDLDEWLGGLYAVYKATGDKTCHRLLSDAVTFVLDNMIEDDFLSAVYLVNQGKAVSYYEPWSAGLLEVFCEMREDFPMAFNISLAIMKQWINDDYFVSYGLFPYLTPRSSIGKLLRKHLFRNRNPAGIYAAEPAIPSERRLKSMAVYLVERFRFETSSCWYSFLMKSNSTPAFCLLELYLATSDNFWRDALCRWINSATKAFHDSGKVYMEYHPANGTKKSPSVVPAFILADIICDASALAGVTGYLDTVRDILDHQLGQRIDTGLIPMSENSQTAHIDHQIDFAVSLRRYGQLSGDESYSKKSMRLTKTVLEEHYSPEGYFTYSGQEASSVIDPKYNALALKGMINLLTHDSPIYPGLRDIFKDR